MSSFAWDFTKAERDAFHTRIATLRARTAGTTFTAAQADAVTALLLDMKELLTDTPQFTSEDVEFSRGLNAEGIPNVPEFRHEFYMVNDYYRCAWLYDHAPEFRAEADADPRMMVVVNKGKTEHPYREEDPYIVHRSLYRHGWRKLEPGEVAPSSPMGRMAPKLTSIIPSVAHTSVVPAFDAA